MCIFEPIISNNMSRSILRNKFLKSSFVERDKKNPHRQDEMPKNRPSKYIETKCGFSTVSWLQEPGSFGGHKVKHQGHRMVSGIVRQKVKEEIRKEIQDNL